MPLKRSSRLGFCGVSLAVSRQMFWVAAFGRTHVENR